MARLLTTSFTFMLLWVPEHAQALRREAQDAERVAALPADLSGALKQLLAERASLLARVENLEAIIAAQAAREQAAAGRALPAGWEELSAQEPAEALARAQQKPNLR